MVDVSTTVFLDKVIEAALYYLPKCSMLVFPLKWAHHGTFPASQNVTTCCFALFYTILNSILDCWLDKTSKVQKVQVSTDY